MVKANITNPDGTKISIEGKLEEVSTILKLLNSREVQEEHQRERVLSLINKSKRKSEKKRSSFPEMIEELIEESFFDSPKSLVEIKNALAEKGHVYGLSQVSTPILRCVRRRILRRLKEGKKWEYVKR